jgi:uncharacterized protein (TIGR02145 family)
VYRNLELTVKPTGYATGITVAPVNGTSSIEVGKSLQLQATVAPLAAYPVVSWSIDNPTVAFINASTGLVSAIQTGDAIVTATATDGGGATEDYPITVVPSTVPPLATDVATIGGVEYKTYNYNGTVWTVENMRHGTANATMYDNDPERPSYYYTWSQAQAPDLCTDGFVLPTALQYEMLMGYLIGPFATAPEIAGWQSVAAYHGYRTNATGAFRNWGEGGYWWSITNGAPGRFYTSDTWLENISALPTPSSYVFSVRCVQE